MKIEVRYFAAVRERLGVSSETVELADRERVDVATLWDVLCARHPALTALRRHLRMSVNLEFTDDTGGPREVTDGDEVGLIPPVAGGADTALLTDEVLDTARVMARVSRPEAGAVVVFEGVVRNHSKGQAVEYLEYEVYPAMAEAKLAQVIAETESAYPQVRCAVMHRHGRLEVGESAVVIAVSSPHRAVAFEACARTIDRIKEIVPIWKREVGPDGSSWVGMGS